MEIVFSKKELSEFALSSYVLCPRPTIRMKYLKFCSKIIFQNRPYDWDAQFTYRIIIEGT